MVRLPPVPADRSQSYQSVHVSRVNLELDVIAALKSRVGHVKNEH